MKTLFFALLVAASALAQGLPPQVTAANERIAAKDFDAAIKILEDFTAAPQPRGPALTLLATTYEQKGDLDGALRTYERLAKLPAFRGQAAFGLAAIRATRHENDAAFEALQRVKATGSFDMDQLREDARFAELRKEARFASLFPRPEDFANPFVEKTRVLQEIRGDAKGAQFGWIARRIGDVDGDRIADFTTSAPTYDTDKGRVYVYSSRSGKLLWSATGKSAEQLGTGIEGAGDTNHDGIPDVVAGAPGSGHVYVYSGRTGKVLLTLGTGDANEALGSHASTAGDVNHDGYADVIAGAPGASRAYVYSGKDGAVLLKLDGERANDAFGSTVAGDRGTLMVGAPGAGPRNTGRVYVYKDLSAKPAYVFESDETGGAFGGMFLSIVGDTNGDKVRDFYVSDWANAAKGRGTGRIYVYSGKDGSLLFALTGENAGDGFGIGVADAGDVDRDGAADLIVGAWQQSSGASSGGKVYLYSGRTQKLLYAITCRTAGDTFGFDTTNLGDVDGDGANDFLITSAWSGVSGFQSGRVFVIAGNSPARPSS